MNETTKENPLAYESVFKLMVKFAIPSIIAMLVGAVYNIVDQLFIGQKVGMLGNAATNIAFPLTVSCTAIALLFGIGGASCFNLALGQGNDEEAPYYVGNSTTFLALCGVLIMGVSLIFLNPLLRLFGAPDDVMPYAIDYVSICAIGFPFLILTTGGGHLMRADGSPTMTMICSISGAVLNIVLDAVFVFGFEWGMKGAALATVIGQLVSAIIVVVYMFNFKTVTLKLKHFIPKARYSVRVMSIGMASFFNQLAIMIVQITLNNILKHYGALSVYGDAIPIACSGIIMKVNQIMIAIIVGLGQGTQPIESFNYGAGQYKRVREAYAMAISVGAVIAVGCFAMFQLFPREILSLFGSGSEEYFEFGERFFKIFLFFTWLLCLQPITATFFTSIGKPIKGMLLSLTRQVIFFIPLLIILPKFFGIDGVLYSAPIADVIAAIITVVMAMLEFRKMRQTERKGA